MLNKIQNKIQSLKHRRMSPTEYAKDIGVIVGKNCDLDTRSFGSEPYLIEIGDNVSTSQNVNFVTHDGSMRVLRLLYSEYSGADSFGRIKIGNNVFIGINATILPHTTIGDNVIVGAGSIVRGNLKENSVYAGVPVKYICSIEEYLEKNKENFDDTKHLNYQNKRAYLFKKYEL